MCIFGEILRASDSKTRQLAYTPVRWRLQIQSCRHRCYLFLQTIGLGERHMGNYTYAHPTGVSSKTCPVLTRIWWSRTKTKLYTHLCCLSIGCFNSSRPPLHLHISKSNTDILQRAILDQTHVPTQILNQVWTHLRCIYFAILCGIWSPSMCVFATCQRPNRRR